MKNEGEVETKQRKEKNIASVNSNNVQTVRAT